MRSTGLAAARNAFLALFLISTVLVTFTVSAIKAKHAYADTVSGAVSWAESKLGQSIYINMCLQFVHDAYSKGSGVDIGSAYNAITYWNNYPSAQHKGDTNPPVGALVFWGPNQWNSDGHVALSIGNSTVISSSERSYTTIHEFTIADRNNAGYASTYLGWMAPHGVTLGTTGIGGGGASSWTAGRLDAWIEQATPNGSSNLGHLFYDQNGWHPWETIPGNQLMTSQPAVVSWAIGRIDVFARGQAGNLIHEWLDGGTWYNWESLGGCIIGSPTVTTWGPGRLDIMVKGCNTSGANLYHIWYDGSWHPWEQLATNARMASSPSAVSWGPGRIDVFSQGTDLTLIHTWFDGSWHSWESLGGCLMGPPAASSWGYGRLDAWVQSCFYSGSNFSHIWYDTTSGWHPFEGLPSNVQITGVIGAVSWAYGRIDMFTRNSDNTLEHWWYDGAWEGPENKGGSIAA